MTGTFVGPAPDLQVWAEAWELRAPVVVGCSGGADSLALLVHAVDAELAPIAVHVDHGLRPGGADEAARVAAAAAALGADSRTVAVDVGAGPNVEARARDARLAALERVRAECGATAVLLGHTADDQAETVLLALLRGSGRAGLGGMPPRRGHLVRPLLGVRRADTHAVCAARGLTPLEDPTNTDESLRRNAIRHTVLPLLDDVAARDLVPVLARQAELLREESVFLDGLADELLAVACVEHEAGALQARVLAQAPRALARRAVRRWLGPPWPSLDDVDRVLAVAHGAARATEVGGERVARRDGVLRRGLPCRPSAGPVGGGT